jgi:hypothetical protein
VSDHTPPSCSGSKQAVDATRAFVRPCERRTARDDRLCAELDALVGRAATMELREGVAAERLRADADVLLTHLVAAGGLPTYMTIAPDDPLVVVIRMLAVVARRVQRSRSNGARMTGLPVGRG